MKGFYTSQRVSIRARQITVGSRNSSKDLNWRMTVTVTAQGVTYLLDLHSLSNNGGRKMKLDNKVAIVTGGSRGIGQTIALTLAKEGADVVVNYKQDRQAAENVANSIKDMGRRAIVIGADVSSYEQVKKMVDVTLKEFARIDILVNNAGIFKDSTIAKMTDETWDEVISTNLTGTFNCTKSVIDIMRNQKSGRIINITSVVGQIGVAGAANYAASKAGVIGFTKATAKEVAKKGITVNAIALGYIYEGMLKRLPQEMQDSILSQIPLGRFGKPEEVGSLVAYLASDDAGYITGQVINLNGGYYM